jgi:hypothetical protein
MVVSANSTFRPRAWPFHSQYSTLIISQQQTLLAEFLQQRLNLGVLELHDLLLKLVHENSDGGQQDVPGLEKEGHGYRPKTASLQDWRMKSTGSDGRIQRAINPVKCGTLSSAVFFDPTA